MLKAFLLITTLAVALNSSSQAGILLLKKKNKTLAQYWKGTSFAFQLKDKEWRKGDITDIRNDSIFIEPVVVKYYLMGTDTFRYAIQGYSLSDIYAVPKRGILISYKDGRFQISRSGGHLHFYWIKSGWIFRVGAAGYALLHVFNGLIKHSLAFSTSKTPLAVAATSFAGGVILKKTYKPTLRLGKKYHVLIMTLSKD